MTASRNGAQSILVAVCMLGLSLSVNAASITTFDVRGSTWTLAFSINGAGAITGEYFIGNVRHGFVRHANGKITTFDPPGSVGTSAGSINRTGAISGDYFDHNAVLHGFIRAADGTITTFDPPASIETSASSINDTGRPAKDA